MKITIEIPDKDVEILMKWASVSRTLNAANSLCADVTELTSDDRLIEQANWTMGELDTIGPVLNTLHQNIKEQIAIKNQIDKNLLDFIFEEIQDNYNYHK